MADGFFQLTAELESAFFATSPSGELTVDAQVLRKAVTQDAEKRLRQAGATTAITFVFTPYDDPAWGGRLLATGRLR